MPFKVGDNVRFLHDSGEGIILSIVGNKITVKDEDGFTRDYAVSDLVPVQEFDYSIDEIEMIRASEEEEAKALKHRVVKSKSKLDHSEENFWEVDLHIKNLLEGHSHLTNAEIIRQQISAFKNFFGKAMNNKVRKIVVIHGVGEGVLKHEIRTFFDQLDYVKYYDAYYGEYGKGATTVEIFYD